MKTNHIIILLLGVFCSIGCAKSKKKNDNSETSPETQSGTISISDASTLSDLALSDSVAVDVPENVSAKGEGVPPGESGKINVAALLAPKKSLEACFLRQRIKESIDSLNQIAHELCMIESQKIEFGKKYKMKIEHKGNKVGGTVSGGEELPVDSDISALQGNTFSLSVWVDNSDKEKLSVYICEDDKLARKFIVNNIKKNSGSKGSFKSVSKFGDAQWQLAGAFDRGVTAEGRERITTQAYFQHGTAGSTFSNRDRIVLDLAEKDISIVSVASSQINTFDGQEFGHKEIGVARIGPNIGSALFQRTTAGLPGLAPQLPGAEIPGGPGDVDSNVSIDPIPTAMQLAEGKEVSTSYTYFDNAGNVLEKDSSSAFAEGGRFDIKPTDLPKLLETGYKVAFEPGDWDCSGTEEFVPDMSDAFQACDKYSGSGVFVSEACISDPVYAAGLPTAEVNFEVAPVQAEVPTHSDFEGFNDVYINGRTPESKPAPVAKPIP